MKVFVADDSKAIRDRLRDLISELDGVEVIGEAESGVQAIESIIRLAPDVVILDIRMPRGNGIAVLEEIDRLEVKPTIIILTNYPYPQYRKKCLSAGADFFFDKSTEFEELPGVFKELTRTTEKKRDGRENQILIVDDDVSQCKSMALIFERKGFAVTIAMDGLEAIEKVRETSFDMIFMDIKMPRMDGVETYRRIKKIKPLAVVTMMTGYAVDDLVQKALQEGAYRVLHKPLDMEEVFQLISRAGEMSDGGCVG